jgi:flagellar M-ring protein FliF
MNERVQAIGRQLVAFFMGLPPARRIAIAGVGAASMALVLGLAWWVQRPLYRPLFTNLSSQDAGAIVEALKADKVPFRLDDGGRAVLVPTERLYELRLSLASRGLPEGGGVGFEIFDKQSLGVTDFVQRLNYQRALQGELARTIGQLRGVTRARVHLVLPQPSLFAERERQPSASVFLKLSAGTRLTNEEVRGIVNLVASSVEGLTPARITMVDTAGHVLASGTDSASGAELSPRRVEIKSAVEEGIERRVQTLLDSALGPGQAVTRVSSQLNFDQVERTEERFDPTPVTRQETRTIETTKSSSVSPILPVPTGPSPTPTPTAQAGATGAGAPPSPPANRTSNEGTREAANVNYEISRIVARTLTSPGEIQRLTVAVLLNTATKITEGPNKKEIREPVARTPEEIEKIRRIVMGAAGYNQSRGDEVTVVEMPFDTSLRDREQALLDQDVPARPAPIWAAKSTLISAGAAVGVVLLALVVWVIRRGKRRRALADVTRSLELQETRAPMTSDDAAYHEAGTPEEIMRASKDHEGLRQKAVGLASAEPEVAAQLIRGWMAKKKTPQSVGAGRDGS